MLSNGARRESERWDKTETSGRSSSSGPFNEQGQLTPKNVALPHRTCPRAPFPGPTPTERAKPVAHALFFASLLALAVLLSADTLQWVCDLLHGMARSSGYVKQHL